MKRLLLFVCTTAAAVVALFLMVFPYSPGGRQWYNLRLADSHAEIIRAELAKDRRFDDIQVGHYTGQGGAIWVIGKIADDELSLELRELVEETEPPVAVKYSLRTAEPE